jgi:hypothetical protein
MTAPTRAPDIDGLFETLWQDYVTLAPQAARVHALLSARGETIVNDHIALRTFALPAVSIDVLARPFVQAGYQPRGAYDFPGKKLSARHYEHPERALPRVFISELRVAECSPELGAVVADLVAAIPRGATDRPDFVASGRPWTVPFATYQALLDESEYAAWLAAFGFRANHFTVSVNALSTFSCLAELGAFLLEHGFEMNDSGGLIKGSPAELLEQSSTRAGEVEVAFADRTAAVPSCYYEFARRYPTPGGAMFSGFVAQSADKLFESTNVRR